VVLRCDDNSIAAVEPRAQIPLRAAPAEKASVKAPSAKVPSVKAPSAKAPSAASEGLGGMFGLFDGACDVDSDGASDDVSDNAFDVMLEESGTLPKGDTFSLRTTRAIQMTSLDIPPPLHLRQQSIAPCPSAWTETNTNTQVSS
jgi:hypothetical protein